MHRYAGAQSPWESARSGREVAPRLDGAPTAAWCPSAPATMRSTSGRRGVGRLRAIWTGPATRRSPPAPAASSCHRDRPVLGLPDTPRPEGRGHIDSVIGPDEYHEDVADNTYTNGMARWNLRRAAAVTGDAEAADWRRLADVLVDGYDPATGRYEQFAGYFGLRPLIVADVAARRPVAADLLLGRDRVRASQLIKQADVLMLHYLLPDEVAAESLRREPGLL